MMDWKDSLILREGFVPMYRPICVRGRTQIALLFLSKRSPLWGMPSERLVSRLCYFDPARRQILQHARPVDLRPALRNHRHRPKTTQPKPWRVTYLSGPTVTSLSTRSIRGMSSYEMAASGAERTFGWRIKSAKGHTRTSENVRAAPARPPTSDMKRRRRNKNHGGQYHSPTGHLWPHTALFSFVGSNITRYKLVLWLENRNDRNI
jgi:hypothetical protein